MTGTRPLVVILFFSLPFSKDERDGTKSPSSVAYARILKPILMAAKTKGIIASIPQLPTLMSECYSISCLVTCLASSFSMTTTGSANLGYPKFWRPWCSRPFSEAGWPPFIGELQWLSSSSLHPHPLLQQAGGSTCSTTVHPLPGTFSGQPPLPQG
jgi:hypothetical protein